MEHQPYPVEGEDHLREHLPKDKFYKTINNKQPLREELSNILEDVEKSTTSSLKLELGKVFGRRALDRRYNLAYFDQNIIYSIGPNLVIQELSSPHQYLHKPNPSPFSSCPQVSAFHFDQRYLIVATEE